MANVGSKNVSVIDTATNTVTATVPVGTSPVAFGQFIGPEAGSTVGYSATVVSGQNTYVQASNGNFGTILAGQSKIINNSVTLNNTGDATATVDARLSDNVGGVYGLVNGSNIIGASNFSLAKTNTGNWTSLNNAGTNARVATAPGFGALTVLDARLFVPQAQPGGAYSGTVILTFGN